MEVPQRLRVCLDLRMHGWFATDAAAIGAAKGRLLGFNELLLRMPGCRRVATKGSWGAHAAVVDLRDAARSMCGTAC